VIESPDGNKGAARTKQETARRQTRYPKRTDDHGQEHSRVQGNGAVEVDAGAAAGRAAAQGPYCGANHLLVHDRVRIDEHEQLSRRLASTRISGRGNLPMSSMDESGTVAPDDDGSLIRRCIIH